MLTITALGDSTTWGYNSGQKVEKNMVTTAQEELSKKLGQPVDIINRGQNATTIGDAIANGNLYAAASDPSNVVVLNFGMNEAYRRVDPAEFRQNILDAAGYLKSLGKTVVLQTPNFTANPDIPNVETYANVVRDVAGQYGLTLDDKYAATQNAEFSQNDLTHPTAQVYQDLGKSLANALAPVVAPQEKRTAGSVTEQQARAGEGGPTTGLLAQGTGVAQTSPNVLGQKAASVVASSGVANDPRFADSIVGTFVDKGITYNVQGDGSFTTISETPDQVVTTTTFTPEGQEVGTYVDERFQTTNLDRVLDIGANALMAAGTAAALGPAGVGLLGIPGAAAAGAGTTSLIRTGSVQDALKAAALAGAGAFGAEQATGLLNNAAYDLSFAAADAAQLANQGLNAGAIAQNLATYVDPATAISLANTAATQAFALADATQLTQQGLNANQVAQVLQSSGLNANTATNIAQAAADGVTTLSASDIIPDVRFQRQTNLNQGLLSPADAERVMVTGQAFDVPGIQQLAQGVGAGVSAATVPSTAPAVQTLTVTGQNIPTTQPVSTTTAPAAAASLLTTPQSTTITGQTLQTQQQTTAPAAAATGGLLASTITPQRVETIGQREVPVEDRQIPVLTTAPTIPVKATESVSVQGKREPVPTATALIPAGAAGAAAGVTAPATPTSPFSATDAALAALLLGGAGSLLNQSQSGGFTMDPNLANFIINAPRPTYRGGVGGYQMPGMFQIAPTNVYNPFATTAPFGTGRFGGFSAPITLPRGLV